jgi:hypothetical protein
MLFVPGGEAMNPMPLELVMVATIAALLVVFGALLWRALRSVARERARVICPVRLRPAKVGFALAPDGTRADVLRCSVFGRRPITCGKACLPRRTAA